MEHFRRKQLIRELNALYLDNFKDSAGWSFGQTVRMVGYYSTLKNKMEIDDVANLVQEIQQKQQLARQQQLTLF